MKKLVLKDKAGQVIRVFRCTAEKVYLIYRKKKGRLDLCSSLDFFEKEKDSIVCLDEFEVNKFQSKSIPLIQGVLEVCESVINVRHSLNRSTVSAKNFWITLASVLSGYIVLSVFLFAFFQRTQIEKAKIIEPQIVKIIKPPTKIVQPEKIVIGNRQAFVKKTLTPSVKKKIVKKSLKKIGALSVLGSLSKKNKQKVGLNLNSSKVISRGPGFKAISRHSGSGGVQESLYNKGMIMASLGAGGNIRGGGGYGTKGIEPGGGSEGSANLILTGSAGGEELSSVLNSQGGYFDFNIINREMIKHIGKIRQCYDMALKKEPNLKGLLKIKFIINSKGKVSSSKIHPSSEVHSQVISSCVLDVISQVQFPLQSTTNIGIDYIFDLNALEIEGG